MNLMIISMVTMGWHRVYHIFAGQNRLWDAKKYLPTTQESFRHTSRSTAVASAVRVGWAFEKIDQFFLAKP